MNTRKTAPARTKGAASERTKKTAAAKPKKSAAVRTNKTAATRTKETASAADTRKERAAAGKSMRRQVPLEAHAELDGRGSNSDPVKLLEQQSADRVPELIPIRYGRMLVSPFTFYRGAALIMATDLAQGPRTDLTAQICGDAHLSNFGVFASPERQLVFDLNDFDETHPGPFEWDVKRLAASLEIAGRDNEFSRKKRRQVVLTAVESYRLAMQDFARQTNLDVWYAHMALQPGMPVLHTLQSKATRRSVKADLEKARTRDSLGSFKKMTESVDGRLRFASQPPLIVPVRELPLDEETSADLEGWISKVLDAYSRTLLSDRRHLISQYKFMDIARKVVGVGSVGTRAWVVLMLGIDHGDPLILQAKEATASVLEGFTETTTFVSYGTGKGHLTSPRWIPRPWLFTPSTAHGPWPGRTRAPVIGWRSQPTSMTRMCLIKRSQTSRWRTPTRTSRILPDSRRQPAPVRFPCNMVCESQLATNHIFLSSVHNASACR